MAVAATIMMTPAAHAAGSNNAVGSAASADPGFGRGTGRQDHRRHHHHRHRADPRLRRHVRGFRRLIQIVFGLSIAFARQLLPVVFLLRRRGAPLMPAASPSRDSRRRLSRADRADPARRRAARVAILNGTLAAAIGLGLRIWLVGLRCGRSGIWRPSGPQSTMRSSSTPCADIFATPPSFVLRPSDDEPSRISQPDPGLADYLPWAALVAPGVILNKDGSFRRTLGSGVPTSTAQHRPNSSARRRASTMCCAASAPAGRSLSKLGSQRNSIRTERSRFRVGAGRPGAAGCLRAGGRPLREPYYLTLVWLPPAEDAART